MVLGIGIRTNHQQNPRFIEFSKYSQCQTAVNCPVRAAYKTIIASADKAGMSGTYPRPLIAHKGQ